MDPKPRPNHQRYIEVLRRMPSGERLKKAFELSDLTKRLFRQGLKKRFPDLSDEALHRLYLEQLEKCHNKNF
jgi:hypothetical protein